MSRLASAAMVPGVVELVLEVAAATQWAGEQDFLKPFQWRRLLNSRVLYLSSALRSALDVVVKGRRRTFDGGSYASVAVVAAAAAVVPVVSLLNRRT